MSADELDLAAITARAEAATPGPWRTWNDGHVGSPGAHIGGIVMPTEGSDPEQRMPDAEHIATMDPATTLALVKRVEDAEAEVERLRGAASDIERLTDTYTVEGTEIVLNRLHDLRRERDDARARLAAVAAVLDVDAVARLLIAEWERVEGPVTASYVANFADMARVIVDDLRAALDSDPAEVVAGIKADAWDEGKAAADCECGHSITAHPSDNYRHCVREKDCGCGGYEIARNPYRAEVVASGDEG